MYVFVLGADPAQQGQGYGGAALRQALKVADSRGIPTVLETMTAKNKSMYENYGFAVVGEVRVEGCEDPWVSMVREPGVPSSFADVNSDRDIEL
jgi:GNAT superfamily N-acetyltransferase